MTISLPLLSGKAIYIRSPIMFFQKYDNSLANCMPYFVTTEDVKLTEERRYKHPTLTSVESDECIAIESQ